MCDRRGDIHCELISKGRDDWGDGDVISRESRRSRCENAYDPLTESGVMIPG